MRVKEESEKAGLKVNIQKYKIMASSLSFHGKQKGGSGCTDRLTFGGSKITVHGDCCHEIKTLDPWKNNHDKVSMHACSLLQSCLTLYDSMDHSLPGASVHGILQVRILKWVAMPSSHGAWQGIFLPRGETHDSCIPCIAGRFFFFFFATLFIF